MEPAGMEPSCFLDNCVGRGRLLYYSVLCFSMRCLKLGKKNTMIDFPLPKAISKGYLLTPYTPFATTKFYHTGVISTAIVS